MVFKKIAIICIFFRNETVWVGITIDGGTCLSLHVGVSIAPLIVLCRRLRVCYGKNRLFMQKTVIFKKNRHHPLIVRRNIRLRHEIRPGKTFV